MVKNAGSIAYTIPPLNVQATASVTDVINAMEVIGFRDEGKEEVAKLISEKFHDLVTGNIDVIPQDFIEYQEVILTIVDYLKNVI
jgi:hypothetical protein